LKRSAVFARTVALAAATSLSLPLTGIIIPSKASAQVTARYEFDIAAKPVRQAINEVAQVAGLSAVVSEAPGTAMLSRPVTGTMTVSEAMTRALQGSGLSYRFANGDTIVVTQAAGGSTATDTAGDAATTLNPIVLSGASTEGSGSYTSDVATIGKTERRLREIPQSVSIITNQQIEDQDLTVINDIIGATNGATILKSDDLNERSEVYLRGFPVDSIQIDGANISNNNDVTLFDSAIYDRVEVLKGPSGVLQGAREPGGTVNLVRKRPQDEVTRRIEGTVGSWNRRRGEIDVGGPLVEGGAVGGRLIGVWDKADSFVDLVNYDRRLLYGVLEFELTDRTTLTVGGTWQEGDSRSSRGLPAYADGTLLDVPRSTYVGLDWERTYTRSADLFANLEHEFEGGATWRASVNYLDRVRDGKLAFADAAVDPTTGFTELLPEHRIDREENLNFDTSINVPVEIGGLTQTFLLGMDYGRMTDERDEAEGPGIPQNVFDPDHGLPEPDMPLDTFLGGETTQFGLYGQAQIKPVSWGTLLMGGRLSWWRTKSWDRPSGEEESRASLDAEFTPFIGAIVDITDDVSVYASYASIFVPQDDITSSGSVLDPREGEIYEVGTKAELLDGRVNAKLAAFQIEESNRAVDDPNSDDDDHFIASGKVRGRGIEAELSGEILPSWKVTAGYTYLTSEYVDDPDNSGVFAPYAPRHSFRLWTKYMIEEGALAGLSLGGGMNAFSSTYLEEEGVRFSAAGYATVDLQVGYKINENVSATLTASNIFDKKYYYSVGNAERQNYYGEPRAVLFKLSSTF
jgi:outer-membrane receptor for ferric coprogen and ferric-rhodotorulic acid